VAPRDVCLKTHHANVDIDGIPLIPPRLTKQAVYLVRDPRDVAVSYTRHSGGTIDKTIAVMANNNHAPSRGNGLVDYCLSWSSHVHSWMNCKFPVKMVRYEEMITDKHDAFRKIMIGLGYRDVDEERLQFAIDQTSLANLRRLEEKEGFRESKHDTFFGQPDASSDDVERIGQWKDILTTEQVEKIESDHGKIMVKLGYDLSLVTV
jgi:aryl sulfotransferase